MLQTVWLINLRELKSLWRNKKALLILLVVPLLYTILFGYLYSPHIVKNINTAVVDHKPSQLTRTIINGFNKSERFNIKYYLEREEDVKPLLEKGAIDAALIFPEDFTRNIKKGKNSSVLLGVNASNSIIGNGATASALQIVKTYGVGISLKKFRARGQLAEQAYDSAVPISLSFRPWYNPAYNYTNYLLLGIIAIALQQIILMSVANAFARERQENTWQELLTYSHSIAVLVLGKVIFYFAAALISLLGTAFLAFKVFAIPLRGNFINIVLLGVPFFISVIAAGVILAVFCQDETQSTQLAMLAAYPTFLVTGFTWPLSAMPQFLKTMAHLLPLTYFAEDLRKIALMGVNFNILKNDIYSLAILAVIYLVLALIILQLKVKGTPRIFRSGKKVEQC